MNEQVSPRSTRLGFTLVELLIAIVVIAILASISVVAYSGVQDRAYSTAAANARNSVVKSLQLYHIDNGNYPISYPETVCLGRAADYPAKDGFAANQCRYSDYSSSTADFSTAISGQLANYSTMPSIIWPSASESHEGAGKDYYRGIFYYTSLSGNSAYIWYYLPGEHTCPSNGYGSYDAWTGETQCTIRLD